MEQRKIDSLIFDMDGTLWDAVDSYAAVWNRTLEECGADRRVTRAELLTLMGKPLPVISSVLLPEHLGISTDEFYKLLTRFELEMMPVIGGRLYPEVEPTLKYLSGKYRLFMASNCGINGLDNFLDYTGLRQYFRDTITFDHTGKGKDYNITLLCTRHALRQPVYVGDTDGDARSCAAAGVPFVWARYGFAHSVSRADYIIDKFSDLKDIF